MKTVELFCGTKSFSKVAKELGHETFTVDKPTDIWTNLKSWIPKTCKNSNSDCHHEKAPRGSKTGTQGLNGAKERGIIPEKLFKEIFKVIKNE